MPMIKPKKVAKKKIAKKTKPTKTKKPVKNPTSRALVKAKSKNTLAYYQCMCHQTQQGLKSKKITGACHDCKHNALAINAKMSAQKTKAVKKIKEGYEELGRGLSELIKASK